MMLKSLSAVVLAAGMSLSSLAFAQPKRAETQTTQVVKVVKVENGRHVKVVKRTTTQRTLKRQPRTMRRAARPMALKHRLTVKRIGTRRTVKTVVRK